MRWSHYYIPTLKEAPADAEVISHKLLLRAGMLRKLTSGIYSWLPLGLRTLDKVQAIVRREMNKAGSNEVLLPGVQPADLWRESGRWEKYGKELLRFKDRHDRDYCLGPTHEEVITDLLRGEVRSYRQLPISLYQIQTKFRDEIRPRFGLMRGREFIMKDAYTFDKDDAAVERSYIGMRDAYSAIFTNMSLDFRIVEADSGAIGGKFSHEFMVLAETGEDDIASCTAWPACTWAANVERAPTPVGQAAACTCPDLEQVATPGQHSVEEVCAYLGVQPADIIKTLLFNADGKPVAALIRGDRDLNMVKLKNLLDATTVEFASAAQVEEWTGAPVGFAGPVNLRGVETIYADHELMACQGWIAGANAPDAHMKNVNLMRDVTLPVVWTDLRNAVAGDPCPVCGNALEIKRGIEVGHIFKLGTSYSKSMNACFLDENGKEQLMIMGCYGIGITRVVAACIEQNYDDNGILFPPPLAPFDIHLINLDPASTEVSAKADAIEGWLHEQGLEILYDDREERPGVKFKDADLIGIPMQIVVGGKGLQQGHIEVKNRRTGQKDTVSAHAFEDPLAAFYQDVLRSWER